MLYCCESLVFLFFLFKAWNDALISQWCSTWLMEINITKTKSLTFSTKLNVDRHAYAIGENQIENGTSIKYLGVHLSANLSWNLHTEHIISKASKTLGFLKRSLFQANKATKLLAYTSFVRSQLEYASIIWHPH
uniref:Putative jockey ele1 orf2-h 1e-120-j 4 n=1 Tax=Ixodes ricinus TaxID=34613 RepID=A0A0K8RLY6_IXORI